MVTVLTDDLPISKYRWEWVLVTLISTRTIKIIVEELVHCSHLRITRTDCYGFQATYSAYNRWIIHQKKNDTSVKRIKKINRSTKNKCNRSAPKRRKLPLNRWILNAQLPFVLIIIFFCIGFLLFFVFFVF